MSEKYRSFLIYLSFLIFKGFGFLPMLFGTFGDSNIFNFLLVVILCIITLSLIRRKFVVRIKGDKVGNIIIGILVYQLFVVIYSGLTGVDTWFNVLGQYRFCLIFLLYFILRPITADIYKSLIPQLLKMMSVVVFMFIIYYLYQKISPDTDNPFRYSVMGLSPALIFYILFEDLPKSIQVNRKTYFVILAVGFFLIMARMLTLAIIGSVIFYIIFINKKRQYILPLMILMISTPLIMGLLDSIKGEAHESNNLKTEIEIIKSSEDYSDFNQSSGVLRFISVMERVEYMSQHPFNLFFGIGAMKEITAQEKMNFISGTFGTLEENGKRVVLQLDTDDVGLISSFMRYGLCYIFLFIIWMKRSFYRFNQNLELPFMKIGYLVTLMMLLAIPGSNLYFYEWSLLPLLALLGLSYNNCFKSVE